METPQLVDALVEFIGIGKKDPKAEVECKLLPGKLQTKDTADRILAAIQTLAVGLQTEENRLSLSFPDNTRVSVVGPQLIYKVVSTNSFREVPVTVERKQRYFEGTLGKKDLLDVPEYNFRVTLRSETLIRKDWEGNPGDPKAHIRLLNRKSFKTPNDLFRIDFSMVKSRGVNSRQSLKDLLNSPHSYELEIEFINKETSIDNAQIAKELFNIINTLSQAYWRSEFVIPMSDIQKYKQEFKLSGHTFFDLVTLTRKHIISDVPHNISKGYTVTNKADGERCGLYVARDRKLLKLDKQGEVGWTGITANTDSHAGDFMDGEYIPDRNLFCIFDVYRFRNRDTRSLPLMTTDEDILKNPLKSRLGCAREFVQELRTEFTISPSQTPLRVETKLFLAGDGATMEEAIKTMLETEFEYEIDGLIFTPKSSPVAPPEHRDGRTWKRVYKWKPANQNSIDFLIKISDDETFDTTNGVPAKKGSLYVSRSPGDDIVYPRETMTGEYVPPPLPHSLQKIADMNVRIPAIFQPVAPRDPDAYQILVPLNEKGQTVDKNGQRVEDNTIVECSFDTETRQWTILRTRYDKTFQYRVQRLPQYGNDIRAANNIWMSMHVPVTEHMLTTFVNNPPDETYEDDMYYRDDQKRSARLFNDVYNFHLRVKGDLYSQNVKKDMSLLELAVGRGGDLQKWKLVQPSKVVGLDFSLSNLTSPTQGAAVRYLRDKKQEQLPPVLFIQGDMTVYPLFDQEDKYMPILKGEQSAPTKYLEQFENIKSFDAVSCQFAIHYACETEEVFHNFAKNIEKYCKDVFFGTCLDGQAVYSLLLGKKTHLFGNQKQVVGEYTKEYDDKESWSEEFGMPIKVYMESFEKSFKEYLVPFEKVTQIMEEHGFQLVETKLFSEIYASSANVTLTPEQQVFSFLNRTFVFRKISKVEKEEEKAEVVVEPSGEVGEAEVVVEPGDEADAKPLGEATQTVELPELKQEPEKSVEPGDEAEVKPSGKTKKLKKTEEEPEPVLFSGSDESKGDHRNFSNMSEHPIEIDGDRFPTVEHYFQAMKAKEFEDTEMYDKMIKAKTAKAVKALGKKVRNFKTEVWDSKRDGYMQTGVRAKFVQHPELRKQLQETGDKKIGFADARDTYWAIGTSTESAKAKKPSKWRGQNRLGKLLMELRTQFNDES